MILLNTIKKNIYRSYGQIMFEFIKPTSGVHWGVTAGAHDASITVFDKERIVWAAHAERQTGKKNDRNLNWEIIKQAREYGEPISIHWYENTLWKRCRQLYARQWRTALWSASPHNIMGEYGYDTCQIMGEDDMPDLNLRRVRFYSHDHHRSHAAGSYYTSPFTDAAVLVVDAIGEWQTTSIWQGKGDKLRLRWSQRYPHSLGLWYSAMTQRVGLKPNEEEYILMGWAALGDPDRLYSKIKSDFFEEISPYSAKISLRHNLHRGCLGWAPELQTLQDLADICAATQRIYEECFEHLCQHALSMTHSKNLVLSGGCALNCVANSIAAKYFDDVWIMPNPGDAGSSLGAVAAWIGKKIEWPGPYLGYNIPGKYPVNKIIKELTENKIVGVANGRAEFGPRALGNRSLFADPRGHDVKDRVNKIKNRQEFRPFAPVILEEYAGDYFDGVAGPYMQFTSKCKYPDLYPAIVHLDGTSRVQTVNKYQHEGLYATLKQWYEQTGCPMILNTSLNIKGQPMVDDEMDAERWEKKYKVRVLTHD